LCCVCVLCVGPPFCGLFRKVNLWVEVCVGSFGRSCGVVRKIVWCLLGGSPSCSFLIYKNTPSSGASLRGSWGLLVCMTTIGLEPTMPKRVGYSHRSVQLLNTVLVILMRTPPSKCAIDGGVLSFIVLCNCYLVHHCSPDVGQAIVVSLSGSHHSWDDPWYLLVS